MGKLADAQFVAGRNATVSHATLPSPWRRAADGPALRLSYQPGARPALELTEAAPDWRDHSVLALDVTNPADQPARFILRVLDRGPGIPAADLAAVLQPYVRLEDSRNRGTGGTGLGLAIANELAQALGGRLVLGPREEGQGLEARVELPGAPRVPA